MESKELILKRAETLFMKYGIKSVTMDDVARELGISKKTLYQHFENKADIIHQMVIQHLQRDDKLISEIQNMSKDAIDEILKVARHVTAEIARMVAPNTIYEMKKYYQKSWELINEHKQTKIYDNIRQNMERGIREGLYRANINPDIIARLYVSQTDCVTDDDIFPTEHYEKKNLFIQCFHYHIHGIASELGLKILKERMETIGPRYETVSATI